MFITEDEERNKACKELEKKFPERFPGLLFVWDYVDRNNITGWQKFILKELASGQKIRIVFISNTAFKNDEMGSFLVQFEDHLEELFQKGNGVIRYKNRKLEFGN